MVHVQEWLVEVGQVQVVLGLVVLGERLILRRRELAEGRQVRVHVGHVEAVRLVEVTIPGEEEETCGDSLQHGPWRRHTGDVATVDKNISNTKDQIPRPTLTD